MDTPPIGYLEPSNVRIGRSRICVIGRVQTRRTDRMVRDQWLLFIPVNHVCKELSLMMRDDGGYVPVPSNPQRGTDPDQCWSIGRWMDVISE